MITVIAGVNGAGKSSVIGSYLRENCSEYFNPDEHTIRLLEENPMLTESDANSGAWLLGKRLLEDAIRTNSPFTFETTLGGSTITGILLNHLRAGGAVRVIYCGLTSPELHIERVAVRVANGGHDIPEEKIRARYIQSAYNLAKLIEAGADAVVYDNSAPLNQDGKPSPLLQFTLRQNSVYDISGNMAEWAKSLAVAAMKRDMQLLN